MLVYGQIGCKLSMAGEGSQAGEGEKRTVTRTTGRLERESQESQEH